MCWFLKLKNISLQGSVLQNIYFLRIIGSGPSKPHHIEWKGANFHSPSVCHPNAITTTPSFQFSSRPITGHLQVDIYLLSSTLSELTVHWSQVWTEMVMGKKNSGKGEKSGKMLMVHLRKKRFCFKTYISLLSLQTVQQAWIHNHMMEKGLKIYFIKRQAKGENKNLQMHNGIRLSWRRNAQNHTW